MGILKKAIDIIRHIKCSKTISPTAYPTAFPTATPTEYPTAYPTIAPTAFPTHTGGNCDGDWQFMSKVYGAQKEQYSVPMYTKGVTYGMGTMAFGDCKEIETSHQTVTGVTQVIKHQYKCCTTGVYGSIATAANEAASTNKLCSATAETQLSQY